MGLKLMLLPNERLHCLASSISYVLERQKKNVSEFEMMMSPCVFEQRGDSIDTNMNDAIFR